MSTTAASYAEVDEQAMVRALERVNALADLAARRAASTEATGLKVGDDPGFAFAYDPETVRELDAPASGGERSA